MILRLTFMVCKSYEELTLCKIENRDFLAAFIYTALRAKQCLMLCGFNKKNTPVGALSLGFSLVDMSPK